MIANRLLVMHRRRLASRLTAELVDLLDLDGYLPRNIAAGTTQLARRTSADAQGRQRVRGRETAYRPRITVVE